MASSHSKQKSQEEKEEEKKVLMQTAISPTLAQDAKETYPIAHIKVKNLCVAFIKLKQEEGTDLEQALYKTSIINQTSFSMLSQE